jgi:hypothetical protein
MSRLSAFELVSSLALRRRCSRCALAAAAKEHRRYAGATEIFRQRVGSSTEWLRAAIPEKRPCDPHEGDAGARA